MQRLTPNIGGAGLMHGQGTRSHILQLKISQLRPGAVKINKNKFFKKWEKTWTDNSQNKILTVTLKHMKKDVTTHSYLEAN